MPRLKPKLKRPPIPQKTRKEAMQKNDGICMASGCKAKGMICEHVIPWIVCLEHKLDNLEPRCKAHAAEKTASEQKTYSKVRRLTGFTKAQWTGTNEHRGRIPQRKDPWKNLMGLKRDGRGK